MKVLSKISLFLIIFHATINNSFSQGIGFGISYGTAQVIGGEFVFMSKKNIFLFGASIQLSNKKGEAVDNQLPNYGRTVDGEGEYFLTIDLGYGKVIGEKFTVEVSVSLGQNYRYTNYIDNRFSSGGYHLVEEENFVGGIGANIGYMISNNFNFYLGLNSLKKFQLGARILF